MADVVGQEQDMKTSSSLASSTSTSATSPVPNSNVTANNNTNNNNDNNGGTGDLFSPTSAAAWALSTLHNFGAAAPSDNGNGPRPTTDSLQLTGTRLFNNNNNNNNNTGVTTSADAVHSAADAVHSAPSGPNQINNAAGYGAGAHSQATPSVTWGQPQFKHPNNSNFVDPSPLVVRTNEMQVAGSAQREKPLARMMPSTSMVTPTPKKLKVDGNNTGSTTTYSRKKKSLGVLAENFLNHYKKLPPGSVIIVDHAAVDLGVERRRIYDVVNILESVSLVTKKQKNTYSWMGMDHLDDMFGDLQSKAILDYPEDAKRYLDSTIAVEENKIDGNGNQTSTPTEPKPFLKHTKSKENKSLAKLSQEFLQVFLVGFETLSLPEASDKIQGTTSMEELIAMGGGARVKSTADGDIPDARELKAAAARGLKTKIRRLYDIANVFLSVGLLRKVENIDTSRRPNFAWSYKLSAQEVYNQYKNKTTPSKIQPTPESTPSLSQSLSSIAASVRHQV